MICRRCLLRAARRNATLTPIPTRPFSITSSKLSTPIPADVATQTNPRPNDLPAATSTSAAQPFSKPLTYSPENYKDLPIETTPKKEGRKQHVPSSVAAGTVMKGLNFMKTKQDPVALEDEEYPAWLWGVLEEVGGKGRDGEGVEEGDLFAKSKKQRRKAAKALRKQQLLNPELLQPKVPIYEQSVDLPAGDGTLSGAREAGEAREELTRTMRQKRRAKIKEDNFLKAMG